MFQMAPCITGRFYPQPKMHSTIEAYVHVYTHAIEIRKCFISSSIIPYTCMASGHGEADNISAYPIKSSSALPACPGNALCIFFLEGFRPITARGLQTARFSFALYNLSTPNEVMWAKSSCPTSIKNLQNKALKLEPLNVFLKNKE